MKISALVLIALLSLLGCNNSAPTVGLPQRGTNASLPRSSGAQSFDYYLLNLSWSPEFCYSHPNAPECGRHASFVLHGLWPQNSDGTYPQNCSNAPGPANPSEYSDIYPDPSLLEHEWQTHGTCSGLSPDAFFQTARAAFQSVKVPAMLAQLQNQISLPPNQILSLVEQSNPGIPQQSLALSCGNNSLTAIEVCLDKQLHPLACGAVHSCGARTVKIPPP